MKNWFKIAVVALAIVAVVVVGLRLRRGSTQAGTFTQVVAVERGSLVAAVTLTGEVAAERRAVLAFDVSRLPLLELNVRSGDVVREGQVLARIDASSLERAAEQAEANMLSAEEALESAKNPYSELDRKKAELDVAQAELALGDAQEALARVLDPASGALAQATRELQAARDKLAALKSDQSTQDQIDRLQWLANIAEVEHGKILEGPVYTEEGRDKLLLAYNKMMDARDSLEAAKARGQADVLSAESRVREAEKALAQAQGGSASLAVAQARSKVQQAEYNLARVKEALAQVLAGPDAKTVQLAQAKYEAAQATWEAARATLENATMVAPFDGTVLSVGAEVGDLVSSSTNVVVLADLTRLQVTASVVETDINKVSVGQEATITFDAFPGQRFTGRVLEVPLEGQLVSNVVRYAVPLSLEGVEGVGLRSGMTANVSLIVGRRQDALLVPALAVLDSDEGKVVLVADESGQGTVATRVQVGLTDGTNVEIVRGLNEGDKVYVTYTLASTSTGTGNARIGVGGLGGIGQLFSGGR